MNLRWRFTGGILFSLTFHALLIFPLFHVYPELMIRSVWFWEEFPLFPNEIKPSAVSSFGNAKNNLNIMSTEKIIFPDLIKTRKQKKTKARSKNKTVPNQKYALNSILTHVKKFPERVNIELSSNKQLSAPVVSLLSLIPVATLQGKVKRNNTFFSTKEQNKIASFDSNEMKNYLNGLSKILSDSWEVPIHLKESKVTVEIIFEINKNGTILNWELEEPGSPALHNSVNNLMKKLQLLPALPNSYPENSYIFGVRFSPTITQIKDAGEK